MTLERAWNILVQMTLLSVVLCLLARVGLWQLRKATAAYRHLLLALLLNALLVLPILSCLLPQRTINLPLQRFPRPSPDIRLIPTRVPDAHGAVGNAVDHSPQKVIAPIRPLSLPAQPSLSHVHVSARTELSAVLIRPSSVVRSQPSSLPLWRPFVLRKALLVIWIVGCAVSALHLLAGLIGTWRLNSSEVLTAPILMPLMTQVQAEVGLRRTVLVRHPVADAKITGPLTWGWFRPILLLPASFLAWSPERLRIILLHEVAHMQRADWLFQVLAQLTRTLYWFHPLVWGAAQRLQAESEIACDDMVLQAGVVPTDYAATLMEVIRTMNRNKPASALPSSALSIARPPLEARMRAILLPHSYHKPSRRTAVLASLGTVACMLLLAALHVEAEPSPVAHNFMPLPYTQPTPASLALTPLSRPNTVRLRLASHPQTTKTALSQPHSVRDQNDARLLRQKLDALEQLRIPLANSEPVKPLRRRTYRTPTDVFWLWERRITTH